MYCMYCSQVSGRYYWDLGLHNRPDIRYQQYALQSAQTAYFVTVVWMKVRPSCPAPLLPTPRRWKQPSLPVLLCLALHL
jgi:hypothetical protein